MVVTGRAGLLAGLGVPFVALLMPGWGGVGLVVLVVLLVCLADVLLAGSPRRLQLSRDGDTAVRLGEQANVALLVTNPGRRVRGWLRDAWPPSAGVLDPPHRVDLPNGERRRLTIRLVPTRRGDRRAYRVTIRSIGPFGFAGRQGSHQVPWTLRALPPFNSRKHLPSRLARLRELDGRTALLVRGQGTEFDSLRDYVPGAKPQRGRHVRVSVRPRTSVCQRQIPCRPGPAAGDCRLRHRDFRVDRDPKAARRAGLSGQLPAGDPGRPRGGDRRPEAPRRRRIPTARCHRDPRPLIVRAVQRRLEHPHQPH